MQPAHVAVPPGPMPPALGISVAQDTARASGRRTYGHLLGMTAAVFLSPADTTLGERTCLLSFVWERNFAAETATLLSKALLSQARLRNEHKMRIAQAP